MRVYKFFDDNGKSLDYVKVSEFFTIGEFRKALFCMSDEKIQAVPIPLKLLYAMDYLRKKLGNPILINSHFRTIEYEKTQGRSGHSQHTIGKAVDLSGKGLVRLISNAVRTKNEVYQELRNLGINAIGVYDDFVHLDVRPAKVGGGLYFWDEIGKPQNKKKDDDNAPSDYGKIGLIGLFIAMLYKFFKNEKNKL
ncbi:MAG: hypothetical protein KGV44_12840 [Flavobacteriaceae bacterium]|nr:hypothetical protein [Flavobacteriaceae bacterium]